MQWVTLSELSRIVLTMAFYKVLKLKWDFLLFCLFTDSFTPGHTALFCFNVVILWCYQKVEGPINSAEKRITGIKCVWWSVNKLFDVYWILFSHHENGSSSWQHSDAWQYNKEQFDIIQYQVTSWLYSGTSLVLLHNFKSWLYN